MEQFQPFDAIQAFKASGTAVRNGVNYASVVATFLYDTSALGFFKKVFFSLFFSTCITDHELKNSNLLLFYSFRHKRRPDYDYIPKRLRDLLNSKCDYVETTERISFQQFFCTLKRLQWSFRSARGYPASWIRRVESAFLIAKYESTADRVFRTWLRDKSKLVTFCDAHAPDNLLTQMANVMGIKTYTNQHGQYRILDVPNITADAEAYANFVSNYIFCWGEATKREFMRFGFKPEQFIITGWIKQWPTFKSHPRRGTFGVMLNAENARNSNFQLIEAAKTVASMLDKKYIVRLHPWSKPEQYIDLLDYRCVEIGHCGLASYLDLVDFSIAHMTGATIEILHAGAPVYLLDNGKLASAFCLDGLSFRTADSIANEASGDLSRREHQKEKFARLSRWFNDDSEQELRILAALTDVRR